MSTSPAITPHTTGAIPTTRNTHGEHHIVRNLALTVGASALVLAGLAGIQYLRTQPATTPPAESAITAVAAVAVPNAAFAVPNAAQRALESELGYAAPQVIVAAAPVNVAVPNAALRAMESDIEYVAPPVVPAAAQRAFESELGQ